MAVHVSMQNVNVVKAFMKETFAKHVSWMDLLPCSTANAKMQYICGNILELINWFITGFDFSLECAIDYSFLVCSWLSDCGENEWQKASGITSNEKRPWFFFRFCLLPFTVFFPLRCDSPFTCSVHNVSALRIANVALRMLYFRLQPFVRLLVKMVEHALNLISVYVKMDIGTNPAAFVSILSIKGLYNMVFYVFFFNMYNRCKSGLFTR